MEPRGALGSSNVPNEPSATDELLTAAKALQEPMPVLRELGQLFAGAGHELYLVGGSVRDALLDRLRVTDLDFTTSARPDDSIQLFMLSGLP